MQFCSLWLGSIRVFLRYVCFGAVGSVVATWNAFKVLVCNCRGCHSKKVLAYVDLVIEFRDQCDMTGSVQGQVQNRTEKRNNEQKKLRAWKNFRLENNLGKF